MKTPLPVTWLKGKKTRLRPVETEDVPLLSRFGLPLGRRGTVFIVQTSAGRDIGTLGYSLRGRHAMVGLHLDSKKWWSDGTATDALRVFRRGVLLSQPLVRMEALVEVDDDVAVSAYRRAGFVKEGVLRQVLRRAHSFEDATILSAVSNA
jgi:RimJ/RimL family protein N-acetyltransferase